MPNLKGSENTNFTLINRLHLHNSAMNIDSIQERMENMEVEDSAVNRGYPGTTEPRKLLCVA